MGAWHVGSTPAPHKRNRIWIYATNAASDGRISKRELKLAVSPAPSSEWRTDEPFDGGLAKVWETEPDVGRAAPPRVVSVSGGLYSDGAFGVPSLEEER